MNTKTTISISEARKRIFAIANEVQKPNNYYTFTEKGRPKAVIMSAEEFESWMETVDVMTDPRLMKAIKEAEEEYKRGEYISLDALLKEEGFVVRDKNKKPYVSRSSKKGSKKSAAKN